MHLCNQCVVVLSRDVRGRVVDSETSASQVPVTIIYGTY